MGLNDEMIIELNKELRVPSFSGLTDSVHERRLLSLNQSKGECWNHGPNMSNDEIKQELSSFHMDMSSWLRISSDVYQIGDFQIGVARPGKEAATNYSLINHYNHCICKECKSGNRVKGVNNPHDMFPYVRNGNVLMSVKRKLLKNGQIKVTPWTFEHLFSLIEIAYQDNKMALALELMGSILVRAAFMLDHREDENGQLRLILPKHSTQIMIKHLPLLGSHLDVIPSVTGEWSIPEVPIESIIFFIDLLGFNEDIKVDVKGYRDLMREGKKGPKPKANGRTNTLLTFAHMLAAVLHRRPVGEFAYGLHRGQGMNPMSSGKIHPSFPLLSSDIQVCLDKDLTELGWAP